ncbi:MAG TPA: DUF2911 domain-containing protein, partial [Chitinophagaceae bacterium]|nr:DUF2911 domain-containing protein [Chitinophagaceae bacterium]
LIILAFTSFAQSADTKLPGLDPSPMDMVYFPVDYPMQKIKDKAVEPLVARVVYSRPQKGGRVIFGELVEYKKVWRLGANEATEIEFFKDVKIGGKKIVKGRYTLYAMPDTSQWTLIINKDTDIWGAFKYDEKKDVVRVTVPVQKMTTAVEPFTMMFEKTTNGANLIAAWDNEKVVLPIVLN